MKKTTIVIIYSVIFLLSAGFTLSAHAQTSRSEATKRLISRMEMFSPRIVEVATNVYTAIGYQVTTNTMIVGEDGVIIIDPGQAPPFAEPVINEFQKITNKPVKAIILTHGHGDHAGATPAFMDLGDNIEIWARANYGSEMRRTSTNGLSGGVRPSNTQGFDLPAEQRLGVGIAIPPARPPAAAMMMRDGLNDRQQSPQRKMEIINNLVLPTHTFSGERQTLSVAGVELELVAAPGETDDQLYVWLPKEKIVFAGDNFYQSWPNVYPLRGTARRSVRNWIASLNKMIAENPIHLVGGHTSPILDNALEVLTNYRDALKWVHDRTIEGAKKFMTPDELVVYAALPPRLAELDYLADYYGSVEGTVRDIYAQDLGWFDGDVLSLHRETPIKEAERMASLAGSVETLMEKAKVAMENGDPLGAAKLVRHVIRLRPDDGEAKLLMADALAIIGEQTFNAPVRNYTLSSSNRYRLEATEAN